MVGIIIHHEGHSSMSLAPQEAGVIDVLRTFLVIEIDKQARENAGLGGGGLVCWVTVKVTCKLSNSGCRTGPSSSQGTCLPQTCAHLILGLARACLPHNLLDHVMLSSYLA